MTLNKINIAVATGTRADYGIYKNLLKRLKDNQQINSSLIISGMHLSPYFGATKNIIFNEKLYDDFFIIDNLFQSDLSTSMSKELSVVISQFANLLDQKEFDAIIVLGDRVEMLGFAMTASLSNIPVIHIHGGEKSGSIDDNIRHAVTKLSHLHLVSNTHSYNRILNLGEEDSRVKNIGSLRLENMKDFNFSSKESLLKILAENQIKLVSDHYYLLVFHPVTNEQNTLKKDIVFIIDYLLSKEKDLVIVHPNSDFGTNEISEAIKVIKNERVHIAYNFSPDDYLQVLNFSSGLIGNSSSGIIEAASFKVPVINVGTRQSQRDRSTNILDVDNVGLEFEKQFNYMNSESFKEIVNNTENIYFMEKSSEVALDFILGNISNKNLLVKRLTY